MFERLTELQSRTKRTLQASAFTLGAVICFFAGSIFLSIAAWIALENWLGSPYASLVMGCIFVGVGLILLGIAQQTKKPKSIESHDYRGYDRYHFGKTSQKSRSGASQLPAFIQAALYGFDEGLRAGRQSKRKRSE